MCELFAMSSLEPASVTLSLEEFAHHGGGTGPHADGWGLAYYDENNLDVQLMKEAAAAHDSPWLLFLREYALTSRTVISHIRKATQGDRTLSNCQPFRRELGGRVHLFAHNGDLAHIKTNPELDLKDSHFHPVGDTDSEYAFCALMHSLQPLWAESTPPQLKARLARVQRFAGIVATLGPANFIYTDGEYVFAHGHQRRQSDGSMGAPGLWTLHRRCEVASGAIEPISVDGLKIESLHVHQEVCLLASVPLTEEHWTPLAEGEIMVIAAGEQLQV